jgi:hypothetical protein
MGLKYFLVNGGGWQISCLGMTAFPLYSKLKRLVVLKDAMGNIGGC